jgi:hypothetical protein
MSDNTEIEITQNKNNLLENNIKGEEIEEEKKTNKIKNDKSRTRIIDELPKNEIHKIQNLKTAYRIVFVYRNEDDFLNVRPDLKIIDVMKRISKKIAIPLEKIYIKYNDKLIKEEDHNLTVKKYFDFPKNKSRPILYVKFKSIANNSNNNSSQALTNNNNNNLNNSNDPINKSNFYGKSSYKNKVKITNYPSMMDINVSANDDIYNIINSFFKETKINSDFYVERKEEQEEQKKNSDEKKEPDNSDENDLGLKENMIIIYYVSFPTPDTAFDFKRYLNILKLINPTFKDIKIQLELTSKKHKKKNLNLSEEPNKNNLIGIYSNLEAINPEDKNKEVIAKIRNNFINNQMHKLNNINIYKFGYLNSSSPYTSPFDEIQREKRENKKKWLNPKGFISAVNKYSGINF